MAGFRSRAGPQVKARRGVSFGKGPTEGGLVARAGLRTIFGRAVDCRPIRYADWPRNSGCGAIPSAPLAQRFHGCQTTLLTAINQFARSTTRSMDLNLWTILHSPRVWRNLSTLYVTAFHRVDNLLPYRQSPAQFLKPQINYISKEEKPIH
ncbi:hypothetical protein VTK26DRAFT_616 [Humicola hyalothermophila]